MATDISVVIPAYNAAAYIDQTLHSILTQTLAPDEIIVVDDASSDETVQKLKTYGSALRVIRCLRNSGGLPGAVRNLGIDAARTTFVAPFDADDLMSPTKLQRQLESVRAVPEAGVYFTDFVQLHWPSGARGAAQSRATHTCFRAALQPRGEGLYLLPQRQAFEALMHDNYIGASSLLMSKSAWKSVGGYSQRLPAAEDLDMSLRLSQHYAWGYVDEALYQYRLRNDSISADRLKTLQCAVSVLQGYLRLCPAGARRALKAQLSDMEINLIWHTLDQRTLRQAAQHWLRALRLSDRPGRFVPLSYRLALHAALTTLRRWAGRGPSAEKLRHLTATER